MLAFFDAQETAGLLRAVAPACKDPDGWAPHLSTAMFRFGVSNDLAIVAAFIAQLMVESNELNRVVENLNYKPERLCKVWPKRFPTLVSAAPFAHMPRELANHVYGGRLGNRPGTDDGWLFRGRGPIQVTGRANYEQLQRELGIPVVSNPELLEQPEAGSLAAAWFWRRNQLSFLAVDLPDDDVNADFLTITRRIQGAAEGHARRRGYWLKGRAHLGLPNVEE